MRNAQKNSSADCNSVSGHHIQYRETFKELIQSYEFMGGKEDMWSPCQCHPWKRSLLQEEEIDLFPDVRTL